MPPETRQPNFIDLNILPEQYRPRRVPASTIILWLVAIGFAFLLIAFNFLSANIREDIIRLEADLQAAQEDLDTVSTPAPEVQELMNTLAQVQESASELQEAYPTIVAGRMDWAAVMAVISNYDPAQLTLTSITQADNQITLKGRATDNSAVFSYVDALEASGLFSRVDLRSVSKVPTPFATPTSPGTPATATLTPTVTPTPTMTPTPTPDPRDEYEIDDFQARDIFLGQPQLHNFLPLYDVDRVKFLAKAGRYYRILTYGLVPEVDTYLLVKVAGRTYANDDAHPGELSSLVEFQVHTSYDVMAQAMVSNRGQYGPNMWYQITVEEVVPTPTPTLAPTSEFGDKYEPDDLVPKPISVGETQTHNFYPKGDVDKVQFRVKKDRWYEVYTSILAVGVDTKINVAVGGRIYVNDDVALGSRASLVLFKARADDSAVVSIVNLDRYDLDKTYQISVAELEPTPTTVPTVTPIPTPLPGVWTSPIAVRESCGEEAGHPVTDFIDGNTTTYWEHNFNELHWIVLDMGSVRNIKGIRIWGVGGQASRWDLVDIYVSEDAVNWGTGVATDVSIDGDNEWVDVNIIDKYGRYIKLQNIDTRMVDGSLMGYEFQALISTSSSLKPPGMASLVPSLTLVGPSHRPWTMSERASILPPLSAIRKPLGLFSPEAVEFVIILELK